MFPILLRFLCVFSICLFSLLEGKAQEEVDSIPVPQPDTIEAPTIVATPVYSDSVSPKPAPDLSWQLSADSSFTRQILNHHPYYPFGKEKVVYRSDIKLFQGKEILFYVMVALLMIFALLKTGFSKYFNDLFRVFFRTTLKQRQIREQLMQTPLPSLVYNMFFVASGGLYLSFLLYDYYGYRPVESFWLFYLYASVGLSIIYFVKFIGLKICGWLFSMRQAADSYIFIVFIINKVIGIFLLPFLVVLAFSQPPLYDIAMILSWIGIGGLFFYRFILGFAAVRKEVRFNLFHFFLYLIAFEVAPLLLIYRVLLLVF